MQNIKIFSGSPCPEPLVISGVAKRFTVSSLVIISRHGLELAAPYTKSWIRHCIALAVYGCGRRSQCLVGHILLLHACTWQLWTMLDHHHNGPLKTLSVPNVISLDDQTWTVRKNKSATLNTPSLWLQPLGGRPHSTLATWSKGNTYSLAPRPSYLTFCFGVGGPGMWSFGT